MSSVAPREQQVIIEGDVCVSAEWIEAMSSKLRDWPLIIVRRTEENQAIAIGYKQVFAFSSSIDEIRPVPAIVPALRINQQSPEAIKEFLNSKLNDKLVP